MIGLSYGGFYSLYTAALEPRIKVVVASCSFPDDPPVTDGKTAGRLIDLAPAEVAGLIAPRALQVQSGINDKLIPISATLQIDLLGQPSAPPWFTPNSLPRTSLYSMNLRAATSSAEVWSGPFSKNGSSPLSC